jgi:hypothetical protein
MNIEDRSGVTYPPRNLGTVVHDILPDRTNWFYIVVWIHPQFLLEM